MTPKGARFDVSWHRRGHYVTCWQIHDECALTAARDMLDNKAEHIKAQARSFRIAAQRLRDLPADPTLVEDARALLLDYYTNMRATRDQ